MEDSWVDAGKDPGASATIKTPHKIVFKRPERSPTPTFVMPALDDETEASSLDISRRNSRTKASTVPRRRSIRSGSSPDMPIQDSPIRQQQKQPRITTVPRKHVDSDSVLLQQLSTLFTHILDIILATLKMLKYPIAIALAAMILMWAGSATRSYLASSLQATLAPICSIPGAAFLGLPFCDGSWPTSMFGSRGDSKVAAPEFDQLVRVQSKFQEIMQESASGITLPIEMKRSEASIRDLRQLVRYSSLASKNELGLEFDGFIDTARIASFDLQKFNSHVGRAIDHVISTNRWTTRVIDDMQLDMSSRGVIEVFISDTVLAPFQRRKYSEVALLDQYIKHTTVVEEEIHRLIIEAQALLIVLNNLEDRLDVIHGIALRDDSTLQKKKDEVLSEILSLVGGNRGKLSKMDSQLRMLQQVGTYRTIALAQITGTLSKLQEIAANLEDLRERIGAPRVLENEVPLSVHIETINKGVERLEAARDSSKKLEGINIAKTVRNGLDDRAMAIDGI